MAKSVKKPMTKTEIHSTISERTGLTRKQVGEVFVELETLIRKSLGRSGAGAFAVPGLLKIEKKRVPARPARKGVPNPFRPGELMDVPAKRASSKVKVRPLKNLKEMI